MRLTAIVAATADYVIGREGSIPWRLSTDLRRFKAITMGYPIVMGRKTFASLKRPLPGRANLVLTRNPHFRAEGVEVFFEVSDVLRRVADEPQAFIIGGAEIYRLFMPVCDRVLLTRVHAQIAGDTRIDRLEEGPWHCDSVEFFPAGPQDEYPSSLETWLRMETTEPSPSRGP